MATIKVTIPQTVHEASYALASFMGYPKRITEIPRRVEISEPDSRPEPIASYGEWRQIIDIWKPGIDIRCFSVVTMDNKHGDGFELVGSRVRFRSDGEGLAAWEGVTTRRVVSRVKGALICRRPSGSGVEIWIVGQYWADGSALVPDCWQGKLPAEVVRLTEVPHGTCINELEEVRK